MTNPKGYLSYLRQNSFSFLLVSIIIFLLVPPFFENSQWDDILTHITLTLVLIACLWVIFGDKRHWAQPVIVGVIVIALNWLAFSQAAGNTGIVIRLMVFFAFWTFTCFQILKAINAQKIVSPELIAGAVSGYLLFGLLGALMAACLELLIPGSFSVQYLQNLGVFVYYSFVTLSTLGYGDILPISNLAQTLSIAISLTGQIYLTIIIAILVGKFSSQSN